MALSVSCTLKFLPTTCEVVAEFTIKPAAAFKIEPPAPELIKKAKQRLEKAVADKAVAFFGFFPARINSAYDQLSKLDAMPDKSQSCVLRLQVGRGFKQDVEIPRIDFAERSGLVKFTLRTKPKDYQGPFPDALHAKVNDKLQKEFHKDLPIQPAQFSLHARTRIGGDDQWEITQLPAGEGGQGGIQFVCSPDENEVYCRIHDPMPELGNDGIEKIYRQAVGFIKARQNAKKKKYGMLKQSFVNGLQQFSQSLHRLGVMLPVLIPVAIVRPEEPVAEARAAAEDGEDVYPGKGTLTIDISPDGMAAKIVDWNHDVYRQFGESINENWLKRELERFKIPYMPSRNFLLGEVLHQLARQMDLNGALISEGVKPVAGRKPYVELVSYVPDRLETSDTIDPRDSQFLNLYPPGILCGEIRFGEQPIIGRNVYGELLEPPLTHNIQVGEGIEEREPGKFYSIRWGVPVVTKGHIKLNPVYRHEGDVNLTSGNIYFEGPVHIFGSIDVGATVFSKGDLVVEGSIGQATVICLGNLLVKRGIVMGERGSVFVKGSIKATFVENATITVAGDLDVSKSVLNSNVVVGQKIMTDQNIGVVSGGIIHCREGIYTKNLGMEKGQPSEINVGGDWQKENQIQKHQKRLQKLEKASEDTRFKLRELTANKKPPSNAEKLKQDYSERLTKIRLIGDKIKATVTKLRSEYNYYNAPEIRVYGTLRAAVAIKMRGKPLKSGMDYTFVGVICPPNQNPQIVPLEELLRGHREPAA